MRIKPKLVGLLVVGLFSVHAPLYAAGEPGPSPTHGYDHPNNYITQKPTPIAENMEPVMLHPQQQAEAEAKLKALEKKFGKKPNLVVFLMDDVGWSDLGFNGGGVTVGNPTPNMDRYAHEGLILTSAYSQPSCTPSRATLNTGQLPIHHGLLRPPMYDEKGGLEGKITLAQLLGKLGYYNQAIGKWHMGENEGSQPQNTGFDNFRGFLGVSDEYTEWRDAYFNPEVAYSPQRTKYMTELPFDHDEVEVSKGGKLTNLQLIDLQSIQNLDQGWIEYTEKFIHDRKGSDQPFFLYYNTRGCHFDNYPNSYYKGRSPARTSYSDCVVEMDDIFGRLMTALDDVGELENTLVILTSDNGPELEVPPYGRTFFRGGKGSTWEGGVRVPMFAYWKGMIEPGISNGLFDFADIFNTFVTIGGGDLTEMLPKDRYVDGIDQTSFLLAKDGESNRRSVIFYLLTTFSAVRMDEFKYYVAATMMHDGIQDGYIGGFTGTTAPFTYGRVFNLYTDPQEKMDIGIRHLWLVSAFNTEMMRYFNVLENFPPAKDMVNVQH